MPLLVGREEHLERNRFSITRRPSFAAITLEVSVLHKLRYPRPTVFGGLAGRWCHHPSLFTSTLPPPALRLSRRLVSLRVDTALALVVDASALSFRRSDGPVNCRLHY